MGRFGICLLLLVIFCAPARAQGDMEEQRRVWRCSAAANERGLTGPAAEAFHDRCMSAGARSEREPIQPRGPAPLPVEAAASWRVSIPSPYQVSMSIVSTDRAFRWNFDCTAGGKPPGSFVFTTYFTYPRGVSVYGYTRSISIDGRQVAIEVDGSEGGVVLSDGAAFNIATLTPPTRQMLAGGSVLRIPVRARDGMRRDAIFNLAGGHAPFSEFERRCRSLR